MTLPQELKTGEKVDTDAGEVKRLDENRFRIVQVRPNGATHWIEFSLSDIHDIMALAGLHPKAKLQHMWDDEKD